MTMQLALWRYLRGYVVVGLIAGAIVGVTPSSSVATALPALSVSGSIDGLYPGFTGHLDLRVTNPLDRSIRLSTLTTTVHRSAGGCERHLVIGDLIGQPTVPPFAEVSLGVPVSFDRTTPDMCQGVSMPLEFTLNADDIDGDRPALSLPRAGSDATRHLKIAGVTFALGTGIVVLGRRRQR